MTAQVDIKGEKGFFGNPDWDPETSVTLVSSFCQMSSVRSTSDGRGPVTRKQSFRTGRSQGNLAGTPDVAVVIPLKQVFGPCG